MDTQAVAAVEEERGAVAAVELDEVVAADDVARVVRNRDDEVEDHILGQQVEEVLTVHVSRKPFLDDPKERIQRAEVVHVLDHSPLLRMVDSSQFWTVRRFSRPYSKLSRLRLQARCLTRRFSSSGDRCFRLLRELKEAHLPHQAVGIERYHPV